MVVTEGEKIETIPLIDQVDSEEPKITEIETTPLIDQVDSEEPNITDTTNNNVFRKLLVSLFNFSELPLRKIDVVEA